MPAPGAADPSRSALFEPDGGAFVPTELAAGPWHQGFLHGAAVAALLAGRLEAPDQVLARILVELVAPVPAAPLALEVADPDGGRRVVRQSAVLAADGQPVARASALRMRRDDIDLPEAAARQLVVFDPAEAPDLSEPNRGAAKAVGWESFDSLAIATRWDRYERDHVGPRRMWLQLLVPVVAGGPPSPVENAVASADYARGATSARLDLQSWSFMNADLVVAFSRPPVDSWVGVHADAFLSATGTGQAVATLHDATGPFGQTTQSVLLEPR